MPAQTDSPSPALFFETINAYQRTQALKAAIELDVFTAIGDGTKSAAEIARRCGASGRGMRILCDYLTILGFLNKSGGGYALGSDSAVFLSRSSPAYAGGATEFLLSPSLRGAFDDLAGAVRKGGTIQSEEGTIAAEHPVWISFARSMGPMMFPAAQALTSLLPLTKGRQTKVLDVSASHGMYGLAFAQANPEAHIVALDWAPVLEVALENAAAAGVSGRFSTIRGDAFEVDLGGGYDVVLVPNFLHHFDPADCVRLLKRIHAALRDGGQIAIVEFVPNPDRITPPDVASFSLIMLASTPAGDAYTFDEYSTMLAQAGFGEPQQYPLLPSTESAVIAPRQTADQQFS